MRYWLIKSEPNAYSIDDLKKEGVCYWDGVRNYQARNYMRDSMKIGDRVLFYHSNAKPPGIVGIAEVCSKPYPDHTAWDVNSDYYSEKSTKENPIWMMVDIKFIKKLKRIISLEELKTMPEMEDMLVLKKGQRLSIQPVEKRHYDVIAKRT